MAYCGFAVDAGTRDELENEQGMAHFVEHLIFKGTAKRKAWHILNRMENVGGDLNAYTNKEETVIYSAFLTEHFGRAFELLTDILCLSCYIWNLDYIEEIVLEIGKLRPDMPIWLGGPEVSYDAKEVLRRLPCVKGVMKGEGEKTFKEICRIYRNEFEKRENVCGYQDKNVDNSWKKSESVDNQLKGVDGITFRLGNQ